MVCDRTRLNALEAERNLRRKVLSRIFPGCKFRSAAFPQWDRSAGEVVLVVLHDKDSHGVIFDEELTLLAREISKEFRKVVHTIDVTPESDLPWPEHSHPIMQMNQMFDLLVAFACDDEDWKRDDVQDLYAKMFNKQPLDRLVEGLDE